jgi:hypothetical protein
MKNIQKKHLILIKIALNDIFSNGYVSVFSTHEKMNHEPNELLILILKLYKEKNYPVSFL